VNRLLELMAPEVHDYWTSNSITGKVRIGDPWLWWDSTVEFTKSNRPVLILEEGLNEYDAAMAIIEHAYNGDLYDEFRRFMCGRARNEDQALVFGNYQSESWKRAAAMSAAIADLYLRAMIAANAGADAMMALSDLSEGDATALASFANVVPAGNALAVLGRFDFGGRVVELTAANLHDIEKIYGVVTPQNIIKYFEKGAGRVKGAAQAALRRATRSADDAAAKAKKLDPCPARTPALRNTGAALSNDAKDRVRATARDIWEAATGRRPVWDGLDVHHRIPLEWAHLFPKADPNRVANLIGLTPTNHALVTNAWNNWRIGLNGRIPTQGEVIQQAINIDAQFGHYMTFLPKGR
jgi:hypothetical protein